MDYGSWMAGYLTGTALHGNLRFAAGFSPVIAAVSVTGLASDVTWWADMTGVGAVTYITAQSEGTVTAAWSRDGETYTEPEPIETLLRRNPGTIYDGSGGALYFRFHLGDGARLWDFTLLGA